MSRHNVSLFLSNQLLKSVARTERFASSRSMSDQTRAIKIPDLGE